MHCSTIGLPDGGSVRSLKRLQQNGLDLGDALGSTVPCRARHNV